MSDNLLPAIRPEWLPFNPNKAAINPTLEQFQFILDQVRNGETIYSLGGKHGLPCMSVIRDWVYFNQDTRKIYGIAVALRAETRVEKVEQIAEMTLNGDVDSSSARVAIDAYKWIAGKENPEKYGDKVDMTLQGNLTLDKTTPEELTTELAQLLTTVFASKKQSELLESTEYKDVT